MVFYISLYTNLLKDYIYAYDNGKDLGMVDAKIYDLMKKTLSVHGAEPEIKKQMYLTLLNIYSKFI
jgi:hypothetical protein